MELSSDKNENQAGVPEPENVPLSGALPVKRKSGKEEVRPGFGSVCFAESHEVRDEYRENVGGKL